MSRPPPNAQILAQLIAKLPRIPTLLLKRIQIAQTLKEITASDFVIVHLHDKLAAYMGGFVWPLTPSRIGRMIKVGPTFRLLAPCNELYEQFWDMRPGRAFILPDSAFLPSLS